MSAIETAAKNLLLADTLLMTLIDASAIVTYQETNRNGIGKTSTPTLFANGFLKRCFLLKEADQANYGGIRDKEGRIRSVISRLTCWCYEDGDAGYDGIEAVLNRVDYVLSFQTLPAIGCLEPLGVLKNLRDSSLNNAALERVDFGVVGLKG